MPSLFQPFRLAVLPRISALSNFDTQPEYLQIAGDISPDSNKITVGISEFAISQYIINPTPKLLSNVSIPSTNIVNACDAAELNKDDEGKELWCYSVKAGKSYFLSSSIRPVDTESLLSSSGESIENYKTKMGGKVVKIKILVPYKAIVVVLESGFIQYFDFQLKLLHSLDISYKNVRVVNFFGENGKEYMFVLCGFENNKVCFKLFELLNQELSHAPIKELSSTILENFELDKSKICYQSGKLYKLQGCEIKTFSLPQCHILQTIKLPMISETKQQNYSMVPVSSNRILLTVDNQIYLLDLVHSSVLSERTLTHVKTFQLLKSATIHSSTNLVEDNKRTIAIGVSTKHGPNPVSALEVINVDVGTGTLKDSLGKSFQNFKGEKPLNLRPLLSDEDSEGDKDDADEVVSFAYNSIYDELSKNSKSISKFDNVFSKRLNIKKEYYTDKDRFICDQAFLSKVVCLILDNFEEEYPKALTFLLTHPLFPAECTPGLLGRFSNHPRLFRQAIVTCPNLPLDELLSELFSITNGELSLDISLRILQDYTTDMIKLEIKKLSKVDVHNFINFMISPRNEEVTQNARQLFQLLSLVLDSIGLFGLDVPLLQRLSNYVEEQVFLAERNFRLWNLLDSRQKSHGSVGSLANNSMAQQESMPKYTVEYLEL
ncbi:related to U3 small nucleolar RNA-associated protein 8 [Zygosaccharomyces bailii]|nr:related to U3 small nucleolar RNA-associated protein 8 [Zygosaccharomyces bailii]